MTTVELNEQQQQAVTAPLEDNMLVLAGAGSGKTRVLAHRVAHFLQHHGISPYAVMAVTFTNRAAQEMRARISSLVDLPPRGMWVGTFHGLGHRLLRLHWRDAGLAEGFHILDSQDQKRLVKRLCQEEDVDEKRLPPNQLQGFINSCKDRGWRAASVPHREGPLQETMKHLYQLYEQACQRAEVVDFAELLLRPYELLKEQPDLLQHYRERFRHILVDEFQDTNAIQYAWLRLLSDDGKATAVTVVGDDDQSVYGWRGAVAKHIQNFHKQFRTVQMIRLERNYRSSGALLKAANALISHNKGRMGKTLWTDRGDGEALSVYEGFDENDEAHFVVERLQSWKKSGRALSDAAVLYRTNAQSRVLETALLRGSIPYRVYGGLRFYERKEIKEALAYLRLACNRDDDASCERVLNFPPRGIGAKSVQELRDRAAQDSVSLWRAMHGLMADKHRAGAALGRFTTMIDTLDTELRGHPLEEMLARALLQSGLRAHYELQGAQQEEFRARVENLEELVSAAAEFGEQISVEDLPQALEGLLPMEQEAAAPAPSDGADAASADAVDEADGVDGASVDAVSADAEAAPQENAAPDPFALLRAFLSAAALEAGDMQAAEGDGVQLMTLHSAKGLEFPLVFLTGMEEGLFPNARAEQEDGDVGEERRLCYVGITRVIEKLYLSWTSQRRIYGEVRFHRCSRFLREIPSELVEEVRHGFRARPALGALENLLPSSLGGGAARGEKPPESFELGQRVAHSRFGEGIIIDFEGTGERARVQVRFAKRGEKWLVLSYARLRPV